MLILCTCCIFLSLTAGIQAQLEGFIVGGSIASISSYPHSAFLSINCVNDQGTTASWICGSSILNQMILLTAGHCIYTCGAGTRISVNMGNEHRKQGTVRSANGFLIHEKYSHIESSYDIALVKMARPVKFNSRISRVAIMKRPPYSEQANIAGWGQTNEKTKTQSIFLKEVAQKVWSQGDCQRLFGKLPTGTICASSRQHNGFAAPGDSGSGLVVRGYIQIGLVSFKKPSTADSIIVYTDTGYFFDWISHNAHRLYCFTKTGRV